MSGLRIAQMHRMRDSSMSNAYTVILTAVHRDESRLAVDGPFKEVEPAGKTRQVNQELRDPKGALDRLRRGHRATATVGDDGGGDGDDRGVEESHQGIHVPGLPRLPELTDDGGTAPRPRTAGAGGGHASTTRRGELTAVRCLDSTPLAGGLADPSRITDGARV
ncbi:hypothetical protein ACN6K9_001967 [Streptomyces sp. SAS_267]|uniref:hypothetical protein n=1 Tax=Streptomyces sp. SAS_267 TaxID=3412750 RepID=UPI00403C15C6